MFTLQLKRIKHTSRGDNRSTVLVIVEYRDITTLNQAALNFKAVWGFDIF
ncbi:Uncharacterised protein [Vibrio cholerae]|nr:Uncharacterised protein [Vibrio cholerae]CSC01581.1 Uncharacterised protein [Vibrio cholerae]CSD63979.1 Uncharacterised protein [Vibrio cholerae]